jgi:hypothetical protein
MQSIYETTQNKPLAQKGFLPLRPTKFYPLYIDSPDNPYGVSRLGLRSPGFPRRARAKTACRALPCGSPRAKGEAEGKVWGGSVVEVCAANLEPWNSLTGGQSQPTALDGPAGSPGHAGQVSAGPRRVSATLEPFGAEWNHCSMSQTQDTRPETGAARRNRKSRNPAAAARSARARQNRKALGRPERRHVNDAIAAVVDALIVERGLTNTAGRIDRDGIARSPVLAEVLGRTIAALTRTYDKAEVEAVMRRRYARPAEAADAPATEGLGA